MNFDKTPSEQASAGLDDAGSECAVNIPNEDPEMERRTSIVQSLAREYTGQSALDTNNNAMEFGSNDPDSPLNPRGERFNARTWAKAIAKLANDSGQNFRQIGVYFQNLDVYGYGTTTDYQKDVGNIWLAMPGMIRRLFSETAGQRRIEILHSFEGLIRPGEMCVVLGPPGAGCSTFLKTISGETNGIYVNKNSYLNYEGISPQELHSAHRGDAI